MVKLIQCHHICSRARARMWIPLFNKAYGLSACGRFPGLMCDVTWYCNDESRVIKPIKFGMGCDTLKEFSDLVAQKHKGYNYFEFRTPHISSDRVGVAIYADD